MSHHKTTLYNGFLNWLPLAIAITGVSALAYCGAQQVYRQNANDPQIEIAEGLTSALNQGAPPDAVIPQNGTDIKTSLQPFVIAYSATGTAIVSSAVLDGEIPTPPIGALEASKNGQNRITWQPQKDIRIAAVINTYKDGYILTGRNLREVEQREKILVKVLSLGWLVTLLASLIFSIAVEMLKQKRSLVKALTEEIKL